MKKGRRQSPSRHTARKLKTGKNSDPSTPWGNPRERQNRRVVGVRTPTPSFLIVCEGARTEPNYFRSFRVPKAVKDGMNVSGAGYNTLSLVNEAIRLRDADGPFDQVWCVFDTDSFPAKSIRAAIALAKKEGILVAYSNEAFELWYFLHFHYLDTGITRNDYSTRIGKELGVPYKKNDDQMYNVLLTKQATAIKRATRLLKNYPLPEPWKDKPSTTVHLLVAELNKHVED